jgi:hypothetical protein
MMDFKIGDEKREVLLVLAESKNRFFGANGGMYHLSLAFQGQVVRHQKNRFFDAFKWLI